MFTMTKMSERKRRRNNYLIHPVQKVHARWVRVGLFSYSILIFGLVLVTPFVWQMVQMSAAPGVDELYEESKVFLALLKMAGPIAVGFVLVAFVFSSHVTTRLTHRVAGPIYRFEKVLEAALEGNVAQKFKLREHDELKDLAKLLGGFLGKVDGAMKDIRDRQTSIHETLDKLDVDSDSRAELMSQLRRDTARIDEVLSGFTAAPESSATP